MSGHRIRTDGFRVRHRETRPLHHRPTVVKPFYQSKDEVRGLLADHAARLSDLQEVLYASNTYALLIILQGMDASGKDGAIRHVMSGVNPQGVQVTSFKHPSATELEHDFLWRTSRELPERGRIGIFNRSYYEEVLITKVHPEILRAEGVPRDGLRRKDLWRERYESIVTLERHLHRNGVRIVKIFLHLSKREQRQRFLARIDDPHKSWKFTMDDLRERSYWTRYIKAYDECLSATSRKHAPWYVVPADDKPNARLIVSQILIDTLASLRLRYPAVSPARRRELAAIRRQLAP